MSFLQSPVHDYFKFLDAQGVNLSFADAYKNDGTDVFIKDLRWRCTIPVGGEKRPLRNLVCDFRSRFGSGTGKSFMALETLFLIKSFNKIKISIDHNIHFSAASLVREAEKAKKGDVLILDEVRTVEQTGVGAMFYIHRLSDLANTARAYGFSILTVGVPMSIPFASYQPHYKIFSESIDFDREANLGIVCDSENQPRCVVVLQKPVTAEFEKFLCKYTEKKMKFIHDNRIGRYEDRLGSLAAHVDKLLESPDFLEAKNELERQWIVQEAISSEMPVSEQKLIIARAMFLARRQGLVDKHKEEENQKKMDNTAEMSLLAKERAKRKMDEKLKECKLEHPGKTTKELRRLIDMRSRKKKK